MTETKLIESTHPAIILVVVYGIGALLARRTRTPETNPETHSPVASDADIANI